MQPNIRNYSLVIKSSMKKIVVLCALIYLGHSGHAQKNKSQELGVNLAGVLIKNQPTIAPSLLYRYKIKNYQLRIQASMDGDLSSKDRKGNFSNGGSFGQFTQDTILKYNPGRSAKYGVQLGFQKNHSIENTAFQYYYGLDYIYMISEFKQSASGIIEQSNGGFDTTKQRININISESNKLTTFGLGLPVGLTYFFAKRFYTSFETRFIIVWQKEKGSKLVDTQQFFQTQEFNTRTETNLDKKGFNFGLRPVTGLCIGLQF